MSIADRLEKFIATEKLSKSAFAQKIGIQRSTLAHFFSGRNKPSSDFFFKNKRILLNWMNWLISEEKEINQKKLTRKKNKSVIILYEDGSYKEN